MSWSGKNQRGKRRGYHHGNLKEALINAALDLIAQKGPSGFTIAEAARAAGVSSAAPYRHFRDRDALMEDIAQQGFVRFENFLTNAWNKGQPDPQRALDNVGKAYLAFASTEPAFYSAMFESGISPTAQPELARASDQAFQVLQDAVDLICASFPSEKRPPSRMVALHIWSLAHGIAALFARGDEARRPLPMEPAELLEAGLLIYLQGLGLAD